MNPADPPAPSSCTLDHRLFTQLGDPVFRPAELDGASAMVVRLGDRDAVIWLKALQNECGIENDSPNGRMIGLIAESLGYVAGLRMGETLPAEVLSLSSASEVVACVGDLACELACLEALRDRLLRRVGAMSAKFSPAGSGLRSDPTRPESLSRVRGLLDKALEQLTASFN